MEETNYKQIDAYRYGCPGCGGTLTYDIESGKMKCDSCAALVEVGDLPDGTEDGGGDSMRIVEYVCPQCGAVLQSSQTSMTSFCSFCGSDVVLTQRLAQTRRPSAIQRFHVTRERCEQIYRQHIAKARFAPKELLQQETISRFRPVYIPFWRYTAHAQGVSTGRATQRYSDAKYFYKDTYRYEVEADTTVTNIIYDASSAFDDDTAQRLAFRIDALSPFHPAYLAGLYAEAPDTDDVLYQNAVMDYAEKQLSAEVTRKANTAPAMSAPKDTTVASELILLPVWLLAERRGDRVLYTAINGSSGEIVCDTPIENKRFFRLAALLFLGLLAALLLATAFITLRPNVLLGITGCLCAMNMRLIGSALDDVLLPQIIETDPTRRMKQRFSGGDRPVTERTIIETDDGRRPGPGARPMLILLGIFFFFTFVVPYLCTLSWSGFIALLISDHAVVPPILLGVALLLHIHWAPAFWDHTSDMHAKKAGQAEHALILLINILLGAGIAVTALSGLPVRSILCYALAMALLAAMCALLVRLNGHYNTYVTRPAPFFGKEEEQ